MLIANLDPTLERQAPPEDPGELLEDFDFGLTTQEVAALMTSGNDRPDRIAAETALLALVDEGRAERHALGDDALWTTAGAGRRQAPCHGRRRGHEQRLITRLVRSARIHDAAPLTAALPSTAGHAPTRLASGCDPANPAR